MITWDLSGNSSSDLRLGVLQKFDKSRNKIAPDNVISDSFRKLSKNPICQLNLTYFL
jgi:hypothetical protein